MRYAIPCMEMSKKLKVYVRKIKELTSGVSFNRTKIVLNDIYKFLY